MANAITNTNLMKGGSEHVNYLTLVSDGTEETDYVLYDSSALNTVDGLDCNIMKIEGCITTLDHTAVDVSVVLEFDATTDVLALSLPLNQPFCYNFRCFGGLKNYAGTGKTGDITMTTTGLETGDAMWLVIHVKPM